MRGRNVNITRRIKDRIKIKERLRERSKTKKVALKGVPKTVEKLEEGSIEQIVVKNRNPYALRLDTRTPHTEKKYLEMFKEVKAWKKQGKGLRDGLNRKRAQNKALIEFKKGEISIHDYPKRVYQLYAEKKTKRRFWKLR